MPNDLLINAALIVIVSIIWFVAIKLSNKKVVAKAAPKKQQEPPSVKHSRKRGDGLKGQIETLKAGQSFIVKGKTARAVREANRKLRREGRVNWKIIAHDLVVNREKCVLIQRPTELQQ